MIGLLDALKVGAGAILGAALVFGPAYLYGKSAGRAETIAAASAEAINRIQELEKNNASFRTLPSHDRCLVLMRDSGLPDTECD